MKKFILPTLAALAVAVSAVPALAQSNVFHPVSERTAADGSKLITVVNQQSGKRAVVRVAANGNASAVVDGRTVNVKFEDAPARTVRQVGAPAGAKPASPKPAVFHPVSETQNADGSKLIRVVRANGSQSGVVTVSADGNVTGKVEGRPVRVKMDPQR
jgi:ribosomal protein L35AE/L33A